MENYYTICLYVVLLLIEGWLLAISFEFLKGYDTYTITLI